MDGQLGIAVFRAEEQCMSQLADCASCGRAAQLLALTLTVVRWQLSSSGFVPHGGEIAETPAARRCAQDQCILQLGRLFFCHVTAVLSQPVSIIML